jgi:hypothetical protein
MNNNYRSMRLWSALNNNDLHSYDNPFSQEPCSVESACEREKEKKRKMNEKKCSVNME